jgi:hypothetical protein
VKLHVEIIADPTIRDRWGRRLRHSCPFAACTAIGGWHEVAAREHAAKPHQQCSCGWLGVRHKSHLSRQLATFRGAEGDVRRRHRLVATHRIHTDLLTTGP